MYARSTTVHAQTDAIDAGTMYMQARVMPALMEMDGWAGLSLIVDRDTGRCIVTTSWADEEAMLAGEQSVESIRRDAADKFQGTVEKVERWQIAAMHREHRAAEGCGVRCTWLRVPDTDRAVEAFRTRVLPRAEEMDGFCSGSFFLDRAGGRACSAIAWDSLAIMAGNRDEMRQLREGVTGELGAEVLEVAEFELAIAHLRVPELV